jgi:hypothetical protein
MLRQPIPDPVAALVELLEGDQRLHVTLAAVERRSGIPSSALLRHWGGLEGLRDAADLRRFLDSRPWSVVGSLGVLDAALDRGGVSAWIDALVARAFAPESARVRRLRAAVLAASLTRPSLAVAVHPEWAAEVTGLADAIASAQAGGLLVGDAARARSLLAHALLTGLVLLDLHPRQTLAATHDLAAQLRWFLQLLLLGAPTTGSLPAIAEPIGTVAEGAPMPRLDAVGMRLVDAAAALIDGGGEGAVKALAVARAGGVQLGEIFDRFQDLQGVVELAQLQRLLGVARLDTTAMVQDLPARDGEELRLAIPSLVARVFGGSRRERRARRLDALGWLLLRESLVPWVAEQHAETVRAATIAYEAWNRAFGVALHARSFAAINAGLALGLAQVEVVADLETSGAVPLLGQLLVQAL